MNNIKISDELKTSEQWQKELDSVIVLDPDGWNRDERFDYEWNKELITKEEYKFKVIRSTCKFKNPNWLFNE
jgi:hypothetical protein